jgi:hypothetical protein
MKQFGVTSAVHGGGKRRSGMVSIIRAWSDLIPALLFRCHFRKVLPASPDNQRWYFRIGIRRFEMKLAVRPVLYQTQQGNQRCPI